MPSAVLPQPIEFGKYSLFERIGRGGMADVFKGRVQGPAGFERVFVIKRILPHLSDEPTFIKMLVDEAKLSARLNHPNIVQIFELGSVGNEYFISMEYIRGHDLSETMRAIWARMGPPRPELVAYIGREACRALSYAHSLTDDGGNPLGMIHRDVSPSNIMLSYEGTVKLLDFGIAKALGEAPETTKSGTMKGKYAYMAPEQTEPSEIDHRIDIFACGIVLHEVLSGRRLFKGANDVQTIERVRRCEVQPPSVYNPLVPPELDAVILKALARNRDDRWEAAADMADALDDIVHAARMQPSHLAQLIYELFPIEGGAPPRISTTHSHLSGSSLSPVVRSPTIQPVSRGSSRSMSPVRTEPPVSDAAPALPTRASRWKVMAGVGLACAVVLAVAWKGIMNRTAAPGAALAPPAEAQVRRVQVRVASEPAGAKVFVGGSWNALGETPVNVPLDLDPQRPVKLVLKKAGFEDHQQEITSDAPLSVILKPVPALAPALRGTTLTGGAGEVRPGMASAQKSKPKPRLVRPRAPKPKGELVDPF